jgi:hypothetical protein
VEPAAAHRLRRQLAVAPVAAHHKRRANADLPDLAPRQLALAISDDPRLATRHRLANRPELDATGTVARDDSRGFRKAVALPDLYLREPPPQLFDHVARERRGAADEVAKLRQVVLLERLRQQELQHRRDDRADLDRVLLRQLEEALRLEPAHEHRSRRLRHVQADDGDQQPVRVGEPALPACHRFACESTTPFARPVVPPVYMSAARSSSERVTIGAGSDSGSSSMESAPSTSSSGEATINFGSALATICLSSARGMRKITGVATAPARQIAL